MPGILCGFFLVAGEDIDDTVLLVNSAWTYVPWVVAAQSATFNHGRSRHADITGRCRNTKISGAKERGIATALCPYQGRTKSQSEADLIAKIEESGADFILLAGFMRVLSAEFVAHFEGRIINIHPSLLPKYKGLDTHQRALHAKDDSHGVTVHLVTAGLDEGPIIAQAAIPILANDDEQTLSERLLPVEHALYGTVIDALITGDLRVTKGAFEWQLIPQLPVKVAQLLIPS